jgi:hypothetical protein
MHFNLLLSLSHLGDLIDGVRERGGYVVDLAALTIVLLIVNLIVLLLPLYHRPINVLSCLGKIFECVLPENIICLEV